MRQVGNFRSGSLIISDESRPPFRCVARELQAIGNNLNVANMDWEELAEKRIIFGVFSGFD